MGLSAKLTQLLQDDLTSQVTVTQPGTGSINPADAAVSGATRIPVLIVPAQSKDLVARADVYDHKVSHQAVLDQSEETEARADAVKIGRFITETHQLQENRMWAAVATADQRTFLILGIEPFAGLPQPRNQVRLWLWERTQKT